MSFVQFRSVPVLDLTASFPTDPPSRLLLDRIPNIIGWEKLSELAELENLSVIQSGSEETWRGNHSLEVGELYVHTATSSCVRNIASLCNAKEVTVWCSDSAVFNLSQFAGHSHLRRLYLYRSLPGGFDEVAHIPFESLHFDYVTLNDSFLKALSGWSHLKCLSIATPEPLWPEQLPTLTPLKVLIVPIHPETVDAWKDWRETHPDVELTFQRSVPPSAKSPSSTIIESYRGVALIKLSTGKKTYFESWDDFASRLDFIGNNHDVREVLKTAAGSAKKRLTLFSEADEMGIRTSKLEDLKWALDAILDGPNSIE